VRSSWISILILALSTALGLAAWAFFSAIAEPEAGGEAWDDDDGWWFPATLLAPFVLAALFRRGPWLIGGGFTFGHFVAMFPLRADELGPLWPVGLMFLVSLGALWTGLAWLGLLAGRRLVTRFEQPMCGI